MIIDFFSHPPDETMAFTWAVRKKALIYVAAMMVFSVGFSFFVHGRAGYWSIAVLTAGLFTIPAIWASLAVTNRVPAKQRHFWRIWFAGFISLFTFGLFLAFVSVPEWNSFFAPSWFHGWVVFKTISTVAGSAIVPLLGWAVITRLRSASGKRAPAVDFLDVFMGVTVVISPIFLLIAHSLATHGRDMWITVPILCMSFSMPAFGGAQAMFYYRLPKGEREIASLGLLLAGVSTLDAWLQIAQILNNYRFPFPVLIALVGANHALFFLYPLYERKGGPRGLDRLSPEAQVRSWEPVSIGVIFGVGAIIGVAMAVRSRESWAEPYALASLALIVILATLRHTLMVAETKYLYKELALDAQERKKLLSNLVRAVEDDRHRMAAKLHELSMESLATIGTVMQASYRATPMASGGTNVVSDALSVVRSDLADRAEQFRRLMQAVRPSPKVEDESLASSIAASFAEMVPESGGPDLSIRIDPEVELDWTTKTIVYQIAQEALRNVTRHANAKAVHVRLFFKGDILFVEIADDGVGIKPADINENSFSTMKLFASLARGSIEVESSPGKGTLLRASLGGRSAQDEEPAEVEEFKAPKLHILKFED